MLQQDIDSLAVSLVELQHRLMAVEQARVISPDEGIRLAQRLAEAELSPVAILEVADEVRAEIKAVSTEVQGDLTELRALVTQATDDLDALQAKAQVAIAGTISQLQTEAAQERVKAVELLSERAPGPEFMGDIEAPAPGLGAGQRGHAAAALPGDGPAPGAGAAGALRRP